MSKGGERWSSVPEGRIGGGQGVNQEPKTSRPEVGIARTPPRLRSPEGQQGVRERQVQENGVDSDTYLRNVRADLIKRGGFFDEKGKMTKTGKKILRDAGWSDKQLDELESEDPEEKVETVSLAPKLNNAQTISAHERPRVFNNAKESADAALRLRGEIEAELKRAAGESAFAGTQAYTAAIRAGKGDGLAREAQQDAIDAYNLRRQQEKNLQAKRAGRG